jgi:beta-galactosidase
MCLMTGVLKIFPDRTVPSYYQYVVWRKSKVEMFVHRPIPEGKREVTSRWGFPDELKSWNWSGSACPIISYYGYRRYLEHEGYGTDNVFGGGSRHSRCS